jgi:hypothetical protein
LLAGEAIPTEKGGRPEAVGESDRLIVLWARESRVHGKGVGKVTLLSALFQYQSREGVRLKELQLARPGTLGVEDAEFLGKYTRQHIDEAIDIHEAIFTALFVVNKEANLILRKYLEQLLTMSRE